jgi:hypothetical protein
MIFLVMQGRVVYEKDLGLNTNALAPEIKGAARCDLAHAGVI